MGRRMQETTEEGDSRVRKGCKGLGSSTRTRDRKMTKKSLKFDIGRRPKDEIGKGEDDPILGGDRRRMTMKNRIDQ